MKYLPVGLDIRGRPCIVVGGGSVGTRKVRTLRDAGAAVTVVSPQASEELSRMADAGEIRWVRSDYREDLLDGSFLAVAATDDRELNGRLVRDAKKRNVLVCDASSAERSQLIFGALHQSEGVTIAVFTDGTDPARARNVRDEIATSGRGEREEG